MRLFVVASAFVASMAHAETVSLDVTFKLTDPEYRPIAGVPVRVAFGSDRDWQAPGAGTRVTTGANGEARFTARVDLEHRKIKRPTNYLSSLVASPEPAVFVRVAAEMPWADFRWLYTIDVYRFADGDCMLDGSDVYSADDRGAFTRRAVRDPKGGGLLIADLKGLALTRAGYEAWEYRLTRVAADASGERWSLAVAFKRSPPPVRR
jgi:hypothetical protein